MIVDSSAVIAILRNEQDAERFANILLAAPILLIPTPTYLETCMVAIQGREADTQKDVDEILERYRIQQTVFSVDASAVAVEAFLKYGKGRGHPAQLNFGDCISYAVSKVEAMPLLFKGDDFRLTDVECAI
jgi:ribonuclease VapC